MLCKFMYSSLILDQTEDNHNHNKLEVKIWILLYSIKLDLLSC